jgi:hypothetical protein
MNFHILVPVNTNCFSEIVFLEENIAKTFQAVVVICQRSMFSNKRREIKKKCCETKLLHANEISIIFYLEKISTSRQWTPYY